VHCADQATGLSNHVWAIEELCALLHYQIMSDSEISFPEIGVANAFGQRGIRLSHWPETGFWEVSD
jgi:hypothetical protein